MKNSTTQKATLLGISLLLFSTSYSFAQRGRENGGRDNGGRGNNEHYERNDRGDRHEREERHEYREREERRAYRPYITARPAYFERPRTSISIGIGNGYGYGNGYSGAGAYYSPYSSHFISPRFALGFRLNILPMGYWSMNWGGNPYYYYNGSFMRNYHNYYEIVEAPIGAEVPSLPLDARPIVINDIKYYEINGNFFKKVYHDNGDTWYRVVGKNGRLETDYDHEDRN